MSAQYEIVRRNAQTSYYFALATSVLGLLLIFGSILFLIYGKLSSISIIGMIGGLIVEATSAIFFRFYSRTSQMADIYHSYLIRTQQLMMAIRLMKETQDVEARDKIRQNLTLKLIEDIPTIKASSQ